MLTRPSVTVEAAGPDWPPQTQTPVQKAHLSANAWISLSEMCLCDKIKRGNWPGAHSQAIVSAVEHSNFREHQIRPQGTMVDQDKNKTIPQSYLMSKHGHFKIRMLSKPQK